MQSFVVELWSRVFAALSWVSPFRLLSTVIPPHGRHCLLVEIWVAVHLGASIAALAVSRLVGATWLSYMIALYAAIRVFEIVIYQVNVAFFDQYRAKKASERYALRGYRRLVILLLHNYAECIAWFAALTASLDCVRTASGTGEITTVDVLYHSFVTMTTFGQTSLEFTGQTGVLVEFAESVVGLWMALVILARFISLLPTPSTLDGTE